MTPIERFNALRAPYASAEDIRGWYGLDMSSELLRSLIDRWIEGTRAKDPFEKDGRFHRVALESFLQSKEVIPIFHAALQTGMAEESFRQVSEAVAEKRGYTVDETHWKAGLIDEAKLKKLHTAFLALRDRAFLNHSNYCMRLHEAIQEELGLDIDEVRCKNAEKLSPADIDYAYALDMLTLEPVGLRYRVWLKTDKPMRLEPDRTSRLTFDNFSAQLKMHLVAGEDPDLPRASQQ